MISKGPSIVYLAEFVNGYPFKPDQLQSGGLPVIRIRHLLDAAVDPERAEPPLGAVYIDDGDLIFSWSATLAVRMWDRGPALLNQHLYRVVPKMGVESRWLRYVIEVGIDRLRPLMHGSAMTHITQDMLKMVRAEVPDIAEQRRIADYLDAETARIDALIEKKLHLVELLSERLTSSFLNLLLGKLNQEPKFESPSGVYGDLPCSWSETSLRHFRCEVQTGPFGSQLHAEDYIDGGWPVVNPMNLSRGAITDVPGMTITEEKRQELARHILRPGDIVFGRRGEMGRAGLVGPGQAGWLCGTGSLRLRLSDDRLFPGYLKLLLETAPAKAYFQLSSVGSTMDNLNSEILLAFPTLAPPLDSQKQIVATVAAQQRTIDEAQAFLTTQVSLLAEHRQALITGAVTGEWAVPGVAA